MINGLIGRPYFWLMSLSFLFLAGCGGGGGSTSPQQPVVSLIVSAGLDLDVTEGRAITFNGQASVNIGTITQYNWSQISGPTVTLTDADTLRAKFSVPDTDSDQEYEFQLLVTEQGGTSKSDTVVVSVANNGSYHHAKLGPLKDAGVKVYGLGDLENFVYQTLTSDDGNFFTTNDSFEADGLYLVSVTGGVDLDVDDDGIREDSPTTNFGTINAVVTGQQLQKRGGIVSALTDIAWRYSRALIEDQEALEIRLDDLAGVFISADIDGNEEINRFDFWKFDPQEQSSKSKLSFDYAALLETQENGQSVIDSYHDANEAGLVENLESIFGGRLSLNPSKDSRSTKAKIDLKIFGNGAVSSSDGNFDASSNSAGISGTFRSTYDISNESVTLRAVPDPNREILSWKGCDSVSSDGAECVFRPSIDRNIEITFGQEDIQLTSEHLDLDRALQLDIKDDGEVSVVFSADDLEYASMIRQVTPGYVVTSSEGLGFLATVDDVEMMSETEIKFSTTQATLEDLIVDGTFYVSKFLSASDVEAAINEKGNSPINQKSILSNSHKVSLGDGIFLFDSPGVHNGEITVKIGGVPDTGLNKPSIETEFTNEVTIQGKRGEVKVSGELKFSLELDMAVDFENAAIEYLKFVPSGTSEQTLEVTFGDEFESSKKEVKLTTIPFKLKVPLVNVAGKTVVSVPVICFLDIYVGISGKVTTSITLGNESSQTFKAGVIYKRGADLELIGEGDLKSNFIEPDFSAEISGEAKPFLKSELSMGLYGKAPSKVPLEVSLRVKATALDFDTSKENIWNRGQCEGGVDVVAWIGANSKFEWRPLEGKDFTILGRTFDLGLIEAEIDLFDFERKLNEWNVAGQCDENAPYLSVVGSDIIDEGLAEHPRGGTFVASTKYILENTGDSDLSLKTTWSEDSVLAVGKSDLGFLPIIQEEWDSGHEIVIPPNEEIQVVVEVSTININNGATYRNRVKFANELGVLVPDEETGTTIRQVEFTRLSSPAPVRNLEAQLIGKNTVKLTWDYDVADPGYEVIDSVGISDNTARCGGTIYGAEIIQLPPCPILSGNKTLEFIDDGLEAGQKVTYFVQTFRGSLSSDPVSVSLTIPD